MNVRLEDKVKSPEANSSDGPYSPLDIRETVSSGRSTIFVAGAVFLATLAVTLLFHWTATPPLRALCFDARQYFSNTQQVCEFLLSVYKGHPDTSLITGKAFAEAILSDGPVFPCFFGALFSLAGRSPVINDWHTLQFIQSLMHSLSAAMVCLLGVRLTGMPKLGLLSGLLWGLYPAAIFWSGVFYTETTVVFFVLLFLSLLSARSPKFLMSILCGVAAGAVILLKPALAPAAALSCLTRWGSKRTILAMIVGAVLTIAPWAVYTKVTTGQARFTAYRNPSFNLAMGSDTEVDGCYVWPGTPLTTMFAADECSIAFPISQWQYHTNECLRMSLRKLTCIFGLLSNDLRQSFFGLPPVALNAVHQALIFFGYAGLLLFACGGFLKQDSWRRRIGISTFIFVAGHATYILFTPTARYGFTAVPMLCVFAAFAIACLMKKDLMPGVRGRIIAGVSLVSLFPLLLFGETLARQWEPHEVAHTVSVGQTLVKVLDLTAVTAPVNATSLFLIADGDDSLANAEISINGKVLSDKLVHLRKFNSKVYDRCWDLRSLGYPMGISQDQFRQWKGLVLDASDIKWGAKNTITITGKTAPFVIYSDANPQSRQVLLPEFCSVNNVSNSADGLDPRICSPVLAAAVPQHSTVHSSDSGSLTDLRDSLRVRLCAVVQNGPTVVAVPASAPDATHFIHDFGATDFDLFMQEKSIDGIRSNKHVIKSVQRAGAVVELPPAGVGSHVKVRVTGMIRSASAKPGKAGIVVALLPGRGTSSLTLAATPDYVKVEPQWTPFVIEDTVPVELLAQGKRSLYFALYPGAWLDICGYGTGKNSSDVQVKNIRADVSYESIPDMSHGRQIYY
ncbi:MAG: hypothetical protein K2W95_16670 [Candidatus Obscuribacterales bacterium]|nr:hypothetical protein [Candidatus Obscuribacterales bacterium]